MIGLLSHGPTSEREQASWAIYQGFLLGAAASGRVIASASQLVEDAYAFADAFLEHELTTSERQTAAEDLARRQEEYRKANPGLCGPTDPAELERREEKSAARIAKAFLKGMKEGDREEWGEGKGQEEDDDDDQDDDDAPPAPGGTS